MSPRRAKGIASSRPVRRRTKMPTGGFFHAPRQKKHGLSAFSGVDLSQNPNKRRIFKKILKTISSIHRTARKIPDSVRRAILPLDTSPYRKSGCDRLHFCPSRRRVRQASTPRRPTIRAQTPPPPQIGTDAGAVRRAGRRHSLFFRIVPFGRPWPGIGDSGRNISHFFYHFSIVHFYSPYILARSFAIFRGSVFAEFVSVAKRRRRGGPADARRKQRRRR